MSEKLSEENRALLLAHGWNLTGWSSDTYGPFEALLNAARAEARPAPVVDREAAWLIEWPASRQMPVRYWHPNEGYVLDANDAVRFCRREDAEAMLKRDRLFGGAKAVEHIWIALSTATSPGEGSSQSQPCGAREPISRAATDAEPSGGFLERAIAIAVEAHAGQVDKAGAPYILHPLRVMLRLSDPIDQAIAVLHDVLEDCEKWTAGRLFNEGIPADVILAVDALTRGKHETYDEFIDRVGGYERARRVKLADLADNMDLSRLPALTDADRKRQEKYARARRRLVEMAAAGERSEHSSPRQVEREGSRDEPTPTPDDAGGGG